MSLGYARKPVDNGDSLWTTPGFVDYSTRVLRLGRTGPRVLEVVAPTVSSEGHPRSHGDGPLTTHRSLTTKGG